ncbi:unnamed protein product [Adineta steineri]|uniref:Uncharacterized protein n=1 Tax=Adineta steineri TaxID=433720 RepID=A0A818YP88_9BILA|nr:unnamed protein product [Adineta steineri]CAF3752605.1 unnamed protein product [Adineta steineri]
MDKQKIINKKTCFMLLLLITLVNSYDNRYKHRSSILRNLQNLLEDDEQEFHLKTGNKQYENNEESDDIESDRRIFDNDEQYMEVRATTGTNETNTGPEITLQNRAAMNTRLRVLYTDANGTPAIAETGRLWTGQTKSVKLPVGSKNINIIVEKDLFFETWRVAYKGTLTNENQCVRIVGVTLFSKIHPCK